MDDRYVAITDRLNLAGYPKSYVDEFVRGQREEDENLARLECPRCSGPVTRKLDDRQQGPHGFPGGEWYNYRCGCGYMMDRVE